MNRIEYSGKVKVLPPYLFAEMDRLKQEARARGQKIISFGIGDPDLPTPAPVIDALNRAAQDEANHHYPSYEGLPEFRKTVAGWFKKRFSVSLDPETEVLSIIGSKEGIGHLPFAFVNRDDVVLVPDPGYPVYRSGTVFSEGVPYFMPLKKDNGFLPDLEAVPKKVRNRARLMFINYPNNPTSACANADFFKQVVEFASRYGIIVAHDAAYSEMYFDDDPPPSFLETEGAREIGIEFHSVSKTFNMTGWRIGFACGNSKIVSGLGSIKSNLDSGIFQPVQYAAMEAYRRYEELSEPVRRIYQKRRDLVCSLLDSLGWKYLLPRATFYVWVETLKGYDSRSMAMKLLSEKGIAVTPGRGFGDSGEGFFRLALTVNEELIGEAFDKIKSMKW